MSIPEFDPTHAIEFDLANGRVSVQGEAPALLVGSEPFARLCEAAGEQATAEFGRALGARMGARISARLHRTADPPGDATRVGEDVTAEAFLSHLRGELALAGMGVLALERWGSALVFVLEESPAPSVLAAAVLEAAIGTATTRQAECVTLMQAGSRTRFLVANRTAAQRVREGISAGANWGEVLVKLHAAHPAESSRGDA